MLQSIVFFSQHFTVTLDEKIYLRKDIQIQIRARVAQ